MAQAQSRPRAPDELDELTLARAQRGEAAACRALVVRYQSPVFAVLSRLLGVRDKHRVEDLAQDTFLKVFGALADFSPRGPAKLSTWILTIATRRALDELRRPTARVVPIGPLAAAMPSPARTDEGATRRELGEALAGGLSQLSPDMRAVFVLRELHDLDYDEIAAVLAVDLGTVKSRLARARDAMREVLSAHREHA
jgi:RNA polymerase sigma-70 factor (ECF subfamily)